MGEREPCRAWGPPPALSPSPLLAQGGEGDAVGPRGRGGASSAQTLGLHPRPQHRRRGGTQRPGCHPEPPSEQLAAPTSLVAGVRIPPSLPQSSSLPGCRLTAGGLCWAFKGRGGCPPHGQREGAPAVRDITGRTIPVRPPSHPYLITRFAGNGGQDHAGGVAAQAWLAGGHLLMGERRPKVAQPGAG